MADVREETAALLNNRPGLADDLPTLVAAQQQHARRRPRTGHAGDNCNTLRHAYEHCVNPGYLVGVRPTALDNR